MKPILKYNTLKGISVFLTMGAPSLSMIILSTILADTPIGGISIIGVLGVLFGCYFAKDKLAENFKLPSPLVAALIMLGIIILLEGIIVLAKYTCVITIAVCGVDELTFKAWYKRLEQEILKTFNINLNDYKKLGFVISTSKKLLGV